MPFFNYSKGFPLNRVLWPALLAILDSRGIFALTKCKYEATDSKTLEIMENSSRVNNGMILFFFFVDDYRLLSRNIRLFGYTDGNFCFVAALDSTQRSQSSFVTRENLDLPCSVDFRFATMHEDLNPATWAKNDPSNVSNDLENDPITKVEWKYFFFFFFKKKINISKIQKLFLIEGIRYNQESRSVVYRGKEHRKWSGF